MLITGALCSNPGLKMQNLSFTFMNIGYTLILSHFIDESHQIYVADHEPQSQALSINKV